MSSIVPGVYMREQVEALQATLEDGGEIGQVEYLNPEVIAEVIVNELMNPKVIDEREYLRKLEWTINEDFAKVRDSGVKQPAIWSRIDM